jgi:hypothetical protein
VKARISVRDIAIFGQLPAVTLGFLVFLTVCGASALSWDFRVFRAAGAAVLEGRSPYVRPTVALLAQSNHYVYPQPFAYLFVPFAFLDARAGAVVFIVVGAAAIGTALWLLGVRDWRLWGITMLSPPVFQALGFGTIGPLLVLAAAVGWRLRNSPWSGVALALAAAAKLFLWPLLFWLIVTRRFRAAGAAVATLGLLIAVWAFTDPSGLARYPKTVWLLNLAERWKSYSPQTLWLSLGLPGADLVPAALAVAGLALLVRWRRDDRFAFASAVLVALVATPILWMHYLALLLIPIALYRPRLGWLWALPVTLWVTPQPSSLGTTWKIAFTLAAVALIWLRVLRRDGPSALGDSASTDVASLLTSSTPVLPGIVTSNP